MTQHLNMNHGHPDGDLLTSILAYEWYGEWCMQYWARIELYFLLSHLTRFLHLLHFKSCGLCIANQDSRDLA